MKVLFVDDEPLVLDQAKRFFERKEDIALETKSSAPEAIDALEKHEFDAVISDYKMPEMDGLEFLKKVREMGKEIPFLILTGKGDVEVARRALDLGADHYLEKKESPKSQYEILANALSREMEFQSLRERLNKTEKRFNRLYELGPDGVIILDREGKIEDVNRTFCERTGYGKEEIVGLHFQELTDFLPEESRRKLQENFEKLISEGSASPYTVKGYSKDGDVIYSEVNPCLVKEGGEISGVLGILRDVKEREVTRKKLEEARERYEELFRGANEGIFTTDRDGYVKRINKKTEELTGYTEEEYKGESILIAAHPDDEDKFIEFWKQILDGEGPTYQLRVLTKDGETLHVVAGGRAIREDGEVVEIQYNFKDITRRVKSEEREKFLHSLLRHDLRNKISVIEGYHDLLLDSDLSEEQGEFVKKAIKATGNASELIEKVRTLRKIGEEETEKMKIDPVIKNAIDKNETLASEREMEIEYESCEISVKADPLLEELFSNLIENSIQHSGGSLVKIGLREENGTILITVEDDGKGVPDDIKRKIFQKGFKKGKNAGSGLGMYLCKNIVESYDGEIRVEDSELGGAKFTIKLNKT